MEQKMYMISDAAKQVEVESHVLRYWEEELELPIKRNKLGHRYYTPDDVNRLKRVKTMKEQGFQLKAIRRALKQEMEGGKEKREGEAEAETMEMAETVAGSPAETEEAENRCLVNATAEPMRIGAEADYSVEIRKETAPTEESKVHRLQTLLRTMIADTVREENEVFCERIRESVLKELDYQFRLQEEREEQRESERIRREEEHFRQIDELIREKAVKKEKRKKHSFF